MVFQWFCSLATIGHDGFSMVSMVANHWSDDGMVTIHRSGLLTDISFAWRINWQSVFMNWMCAHPVGTHRMFYASVKARIDWHSVNSGFACMSCLVTLLGHRFLFERDTLLSLFMFAILVRSYSLQYNQHKCVKISLLNLLHSKVWIHADPQQTVFPRTTALSLVFQCNFG